MSQVRIVFGASPRNLLALRAQCPRRAPLWELKHWVGAPSITLDFQSANAALEFAVAVEDLYKGTDHKIEVL